MSFREVEFFGVIIYIERRNKDFKFGFIIFLDVLFLISILYFKNLCSYKFFIDLLILKLLLIIFMIFFIKVLKIFLELSDI